MARRSKPERVLGPYRHYRRWRVLLVSAGGEKTVTDYESEEEAKQVVRLLRRELAKGGERTIGETREKYEAYMRDDKGNKPRSIEATSWRLGIFFHEDDLPLDDLTPARCRGYYEDLRTLPRPTTKRPLAVDSHRNILAEAKSFLKWCVGKRWIARNPLEEVIGVGRRRHGKAQLRIDEARRWQAKALQFADQGEEGAVAAMMSLLMGMRASEIVSRIVRDLDDEGRLLWIPETKTEAGKRTLPVPEVLQPYMQKIAERKGAHGFALWAALEGLATGMGAANLQSGEGARGDRARDARPSRHTRGGAGRHHPRRGSGPRSRVGDHVARKLHRARGDHRRGPAAGAHRARRRTHSRTSKQSARHPQPR